MLGNNFIDISGSIMKGECFANSVKERTKKASQPSPNLPTTDMPNTVAILVDCVTPKEGEVHELRPSPFAPPVLRTKWKGSRVNTRQLFPALYHL